MADDPSGTDFADPLAYRGRIMVGVLTAVMDAGRADGSEATMLQLDVALDGLCDSIAMLVASAISETPKERRDTADRCRKRIMLSSAEIARRVAAGEKLPFEMEALGLRN